MMSSLHQLCLLLALLMFLPTSQAADLPGMDTYTMELYGSVSASSNGAIVPTVSDTIIAINLSTGAIVMTAPLQDDGTGNISGYQMQIGKPSSFAGTRLQLFLNHQNTTYKLLNASGTDAIVPFNGDLGFWPKMVQANVVATSIVAVPGTVDPDPGTGDGTLLGDINGDGKVDETDVQLLKQAISGQIAINEAKMDLNNDRVVNTRDLIDLIRIVRKNSRIASKPESIAPSR